ncbi:hypothetical protein ALC62_08524 [Cyphomyrmex costatus]|uniref:Uncharacterized protein n=1 Tax=Cyphomyrmex costatus TaxID=456900 RepID=A0A151IGR6_9HYME|nr:hypothetical protein ALC62_08524 [Cyphomyrmex costatus]
MQKCHTAQETLINEACAFPKFLRCDCYLYERISSSLCRNAASSIFCCIVMLSLKSLLQIAKIHPRQNMPRTVYLMAQEKEDHEFHDRWKDLYRRKRFPHPISMRKRTSCSYNHMDDRD